MGENRGGSGDREVIETVAAFVVLGMALQGAVERERRRRATLRNRVGRSLMALGRSIASGGWE